MWQRQIEPQVKSVERPETVEREGVSTRKRKKRRKKRRTGEKPVEDGVTGGDDVDVGDGTEGEDGDDTPKGATGLVDVCEKRKGKKGESVGFLLRTRRTISIKKERVNVQVKTLGAYPVSARAVRTREPA
jgi:hypothetical protein